MNVEKSKKSEELIEYNPLDGTPFTVASMMDTDSDIVRHYVLFGKYRLTEGFETAEEAKADAESMTWNRIMEVMSVVLETFMKPLEGLLPNVSEVELNKNKDE